MLETKGLSFRDVLSRFPHPFLLREVDLDPSGAILPPRVRLSRLHELLGGDGDLVGALAKRAAKGTKREKRLLALKREGTSGNVEPGGVVSLGTRPGEGIVIGASFGAEGVSPQHASFHYLGDGAWQVRDDGSEWGTFLEGARLPTKQPQRISDAETIQFGPELEYRFFRPKALLGYLRFQSKLARARARLQRKADA